MSNSDGSNEIASAGSRKFSRREFLKMAGTAGAALALGRRVADQTSDIWQPKVVELGIDSLENPAVMESILGNSAGFLETLALHDHRVEGAPKIEENPSYKPMAEIIGEVLDLRRSEGKPITYQRIDGYESLPYYQDKLRKVAGNPTNRDKSPDGSDSRYYILGYNPNILVNLMQGGGLLPKNVSEFQQISANNFGYFLDLVVNGSGFLDRTIEILGEEARINWRLEQFTTKGMDYLQTHQNEINQIVKTYLQDIKQHVEKFVIQTGAPISAGEIFSYCMERNGGSINKSLMDTMIFLKDMARSDVSLNAFTELTDYQENLKKNEDWFKANIKDEYGKIGNYSKLPHETYPYHGLLSVKPRVANLKVDKDLHLLNQIGKPYHAWNIVVLLSAVPSTITQIGIAQEQYTYFKEHGPAKIASDFRVALELRKLDSLFMMYPQQV